MVDQALVLRLAVLAGLLASVLVVRHLDRPIGSWGGRLRARFLLGLPWGTLVSVGFVLLVYLVVQGGLDDPYRPLSLPFHSWSYLYPLGWATAAFSHAGLGHLTGNVLGALVLGTLAEYAWGHFPTKRGSQSFGSWLSNPYVRAFVCVPAGVLVVGLATALLSWGPIIGFSGVVFAFAGFALVRYPLGTVVALTAEDAVATAYYALRDPVLVGEAAPTFSRPWWSGVAVQGHLLGLLLGVLVGVLVLGRREERPSALRLWSGAVLLASAMTIWALWWYRGSDVYVLYRGLGVLLVLAVALLVVLAVRASDRSLFPLLDRSILPTTDRFSGRRLLPDGALPSIGRDGDGPSRRMLARLLLVLPLLTMGFVAVPVNLSAVDAGTIPGDVVLDAGDYSVTYAEDVADRKVSVVDVSLLGETTSVNTSGVIVVSEPRAIWTREVSPAELAFDGQLRVRLGGLGWERTVDARRVGWTVAGGEAAYNVWLRLDDGDWRHAFASEPANATPVLAGRNVSLVPEDGEFFLEVSTGNETTGRTAIPPENGTASADGIEFVHRESAVVASIKGTRVEVATREEYE